MTTYTWSPGEAQADFGEADFTVYGTKRRLRFFVLSFPYSNMGFVQVFPAENAECVCQALKQIFEYVVCSQVLVDKKCIRISTQHAFNSQPCLFL